MRTFCFFLLHIYWFINSLFTEVFFGVYSRHTGILTSPVQWWTSTAPKVGVPVLWQYLPRSLLIILWQLKWWIQMSLKVQFFDPGCQKWSTKNYEELSKRAKASFWVKRPLLVIVMVIRIALVSSIYKKRREDGFTAFIKSILHVSLRYFI